MKRRALRRAMEAVHQLDEHAFVILGGILAIHCEWMLPKWRR